MALRIALLGAESTGKTWLAKALTARLSQQPGLRVARVDEYLRAWCEREGRTPRADEQAAIAAEQARRIDDAARSADVVVCDTTPLMTAVYSELLFADTALHASALEFQARLDLHLLTGLDLPWQADGLQRDGPHVREPVDRAIRRLLRAARLPHAIVLGQGEQRLHAALRALPPPLRDLGATAASGLFSGLLAGHATQAGWRCELCDAPECERLSRHRPQGAGEAAD